MGPVMTALAKTKSIPFGAGSMAVAAIAIILVVAHISFGPFAPQKPAEVTIAETAVKIKDAAKRAISGEAAPAEQKPPRSKWNADRIVDIAVLALAAAAILLAIIALFRNEERTPAFFGFSLGVGVLLMSWLQWIALLICGAIILAAIISNLDEILS